jgi:hypothetical protein
MPAVLTTASAVECDHGGSVATSSSAKLSVDGNPVLVYPSSVMGKAVAGCTTVPASDSSGTTHITCTAVGPVTPGSANKLTVGGQPVALDTLGGETNGMAARETPQALAAPDARQLKLSTV